MRDDLFVCVHEQFMTDTAKLADIVLPATTFLEHDDIYRGGGHSFLQVTRKVIEPMRRHARTITLFASLPSGSVHSTAVSR